MSEKMEIQNFELTAIQENAFIYETHLRNINRRRELWKTEIKHRLKGTLEAIQKNFPKVDWFVQVVDSKTNYETMALKIKDTPSGITDQSEGFSHLKKGAALCFSQMLSGKIKVWMEYPFVEGVQKEKEPVKDIVIVDPSYINENLIAGYVQQFLHEITAYESNS